MSQKLFLAPAVILALGFLGGTAHAATTISYTNTSSQNSFDSAGNYAFTLPTFDTALGTLTGVSVSLGSYSSTYFEVYNLGSVGGTAVGSSTLNLTLTGPGVGDVTQVGISSGQQSVFVPGGFGNLQSGSNGPSFAAGTQTINATDFAAFETGTTDSYTLSQSFTTSGSPITPGASLAVGGAASENNQATVTYTYTPDASAAPEPSQVGMLALMGLGLGGLILRARKAKAVAS